MEVLLLSWCDDPERFDKAGIPEEEREFKTKIDLAYEMIVHQLELGTSFDYVGADGFYGNDCNLAMKVDLLGLTCISCHDPHKRVIWMVMVLQKPVPNVIWQRQLP